MDEDLLEKLSLPKEKDQVCLNLIEALRSKTVNPTHPWRESDPQDQVIEEATLRGNLSDKRTGHKSTRCFCALSFCCFEGMTEPREEFEEK